MQKPLPFKMHASDPLSAWRASTFWAKEPETISWLEYFSNKATRRVSTLVDVGANIGVYTLYWLSLSDNSNAISCEPFEPNQKLLSANASLNGFSSRVKLISEPLYDAVGLGFVNIEDDRPGGSGFRYSIGQHLDKKSEIVMKALTLDLILAPSMVNHILKIDVDGNDFEILRGGESSLSSGNIESVLIEADLDQQLKIAKYLEGFGYCADARFNDFPSHSDHRRILNGTSERNRVYSLRL